MQYIISDINNDDIYDIEKLGEASLPIYYKSSDLFFLLFDSSYVLYKICLKKSWNDTNHSNRKLFEIIAYVKDPIITASNIVTPKVK